MTRYKFEIQNCIEIVIEGESKEEARNYLVNNPDCYSEDMCGSSCFISDGQETEDPES